MLHILFYLFAFLAVTCGLMVVLSREPVRCVLFLVATFLATAAVWMILHAEFLALILVVVYVGAVMTLFLFVVMMLNVKEEAHKKSFVRYLPIGAVIVLLLMGFTDVIIAPSHFGLSQIPVPKSADFNNIANLGMVLYTDYAYPFEIAAVLLLTAIVAAICLSHREPKHRKMQNINAQVAARPGDRVRLIKMPAEKKRP